MHKKIRMILVIVIAVSVVCIIFFAGNVLLINQRVERTNIFIDTELFELCDYLYDTRQNDVTYTYYSIIFQEKDTFDFFEKSGIDKDEITDYVTRWGAKYLIASCVINEKEKAVSDINSFLTMIDQQPELINTFIYALEQEFYNKNGIRTSLYESFELKKFLGCFGSSLDTVNIPFSSKEKCYNFIDGKYASIGDFRAAHIYDQRANGMNIPEKLGDVGSFDGVGYTVRFIIIAICVLIFITAIFLFKRKKIVAGLLCVLCSGSVFVISFLTVNIEKTDINDNIEKYCEIIATQYLPSDNLNYNIYLFDCDDYYGTVCFSKESAEQKQKELSKKSVSVVSNDCEKTLLYSPVSCIRDNYGLPNCSIGMATFYIDDVRVFVKYTFKNNNKFGFMKYLTFDEYIFPNTVDIGKIIESIIKETETTIEK